MLKNLSELSLERIKIDDKFWKHRLNINRTVTLNHQYRQLEKTGRIKNFRRVVEGKKGNYSGIYFNDSDIYKWLEAASYTLINHYDPELENRINELVKLVAAAQQEDGYLNTYFTLVEPEKKWTNLGMMHELYCAGHLFQAAAAHYKTTGKKDLLNTARKFAFHIDDVFRVSKKNGIPGHEEIEVGLMGLFKITEEKRFLKLAQYFIDNRGRKDSCFRQELSNLNNRAGMGFENSVENYGTMNVKKFYKELFLDEEGNYSGEYAQDHLPVREQEKVVGHAVRAMYLYSGMTDIAIETGEDKLIKAVMKLWNNMTKKRMYITGGIGSSHQNEGFTEDYHLPNKDAYSETCAAVGSIMWNQRMLKMTADSRFADIMERTLYNAFLSGAALTGDEFFYINPLSSNGDHHRKGWFNVSCCPPNFARLMSSLEKYIYLKTNNEIYINLYISGTTSFKLNNELEVNLSQETDYPWDGEIKINVSPDNASEFFINLRIPDWCRETVLKVNGNLIKTNSISDENGYIRIKRCWSNGDEISLKLAMPVELVKSHPSVSNNFGKVALQRGPVVYCLEDVDNPVPPSQITLFEDGEIEANYKSSLLNGTVVIEGDAKIPDNTKWQNKLYQWKKKDTSRIAKFRAIPYHLWDHRQAGEMRVWVNYEK